MSSTDEFLNIDTPENVVFGYEIVGIGSRFIAGMIDSLIIFIVLGFVSLILFVISNNSEGQTVFIAIGVLFSFLFFWGYYIYFEVSTNGRSPGKNFANLRVIRQDGTPITLTESIVRNLVRLIDFFPGAYGIGIVTMFVDKQSRRLGDMVAGTIVVRDNQDIELHTLQERRNYHISPLKEDDEFASLPVHLLEEGDIRLAENFLQRRYELSNSDDVAYEIAKKLLKKMNIHSSDLIFRSKTIRSLEAIILLYRQRSG